MTAAGSGLLVSIWTESRGFVVHGAVDVRTVTEAVVSLLDRSSTSLVHEMPVETSVRSMLTALVLEEGLALLNTKLLQISAHRNTPTVKIASQTKPGIELFYLCVSDALDSIIIIVNQEENKST